MTPDTTSEGGGIRLQASGFRKTQNLSLVAWDLSSPGSIGASEQISGERDGKRLHEEA
jgi:hypothetical protein